MPQCAVRENQAYGIPVGEFVHEFGLEKRRCENLVRYLIKKFANELVFTLLVMNKVGRARLEALHWRTG